ncbi:hypothetical protein ATCC90586_002947 [Pythium insidiosum]|nr:hypothetical protein ATCC90586_002947 [Pythium insidiosum]
MVDEVSQATRALTLIECLKRLQHATQRDDAASAAVSAELAALPASVLTIHLVGADHREGNSMAETMLIFERLFQYLAVEDGRYTLLRLVLVGPNIAAKLHHSSQTATHSDMRPPVSLNQPLASIDVALSYYVGSFDDYYGETAQYVRPDLAVCFNAGIWGYDQWLPTIQLLVHTIQTPLLITSYNAHEASDDEDVLDDSVEPPRWYWRAEKNPFGSLLHRSTRNDFGSILRENDYWMCLGPNQVPGIHA